MPLETGTWTINDNGSVTTLTITSVDSAGNVTGFLAAAPISGFWNETLQKLTFFRSAAIESGEGRAYTGFLFADQFRMPGLKGGTVFTLAGYVASFALASTSPERPIFGWYAQVGVA
jgi:hypothetical protein